MIVIKREYNLTPGYSNKDWPFSVAMVGISAFHAENGVKSWILLHNWVNYALSVSMEAYGLPKLETAGIWMDDQDSLKLATIKKSLSPFFRYLEFKFEAINQAAVGVG